LQTVVHPERTYKDDVFFFFSSGKKYFMISLQQAHQHIRELTPLAPETTLLQKSLGLVCAEDVHAVTNCPSVDASLKDGFALLSADIADASPERPVTLSVVGSLTAGDDAGSVCPVTSGAAIRIMTGASVPRGATAVLASEFAEVNGDQVTIRADAHPGRNILYRGSDIALQQVIVRQGDILNPSRLGLLAAAGVNAIFCYPFPRVAVAATGSELVWPGEPVTPGKVAASNMVTLTAELQALGIRVSTVLLRDHLNSLQEQFAELVRRVDILITCGGVLDGDKDLTLRSMELIGMKKIFHRVRIGPGKGACMGRVGNTVVFNLPGGPPSNHVAFLLLALPGVLRLMGHEDFLLPRREVILSRELAGQRDWTQLVYSQRRYENGSILGVPIRDLGRLEVLAAADSLIEIPEGCATIRAGDPAGAWCFRR
jgi:molybdopterin molybdotransferase